MHHEKVIPQKKIDFCNKLENLFHKYDKIVLVSSENVNATQMLRIRHDLDGHAEVVFGKNSLMRRVVEELKNEISHLEVIERFLNNGTGLIFTNGSFNKIKDAIDQNCVGSPAKVGAISPVDVIIPAMRTNMVPTQVSVLHALGIQSKIFKGTIEITSEKHLIKKGEKVGASEANLLSLLGILPFQYKLKIEHLFDNGHLYDPEILDIDDDILSHKFSEALKNVTSLSLGIGYINKSSAPHMVGNAFKNIASIAVSIDYKLPQIEEIQSLLSDPEALERMRASSAAKPKENENQNEENKEEEENLEIGGGFGDIFGED
ncbi:ribosomal protein P0 (A0) (L10E) [Tritrichomonas musculus]|uniref:60S acidic ribosomal protein P0 n=1 Tax=Tritrichomonas musculus TaxID=1915356 RepID=A0ABR2KPE9_9EUKA